MCNFLYFYEVECTFMHFSVPAYVYIYIDCYIPVLNIVYFYIKVCSFIYFKHTLYFCMLFAYFTSLPALRYFANFSILLHMQTYFLVICKCTCFSFFGKFSAQLVHLFWITCVIYGHFLYGYSHFNKNFKLIKMLLTF